MPTDKVLTARRTLSATVEARDRPEGLIRLPGHARAGHSDLPAGQRSDQASAALVEVVAGFRVVGLDGEDEGVDEGTVNANRIEHRQRLRELAGLEPIAGDLGHLRPHELADERKWVKSRAPLIDVAADREGAEIVSALA